MSNTPPTTPPSPGNPQPAWRLRDALRPPFDLAIVWALLPVSLVLIVMGMLPLRSWDYWWHISIGRLIDHYQSVPAANHFLYTIPADAPSFVQPWMSQWALFWLHDVGGLQLALLVRNLVAAVVFGLLSVAAMRRSRSAMRGALLTVASFALALGFLGARTHLFVWPLFGLLLWVGYQVHARRLPLAALVSFPAATALWANLHGSFFVPAALCLAFGAATLAQRFDPRAGAPRTRADFRWPPAVGWAITLGLTLAAPLLNPRGREVFGYVKDLATNPEINQTITEWLPTTLHHPPGVGLLFFAVLTAGALRMWQKRRELDVVDALLFAGFAALAISASRGILWFALVTPVVLAPYLRDKASLHEDASTAPAPTSAGMATVNLLIAVGMLAAGIALQPGTVSHQRFVTAFQPSPVRTQPPLAGLVEPDTPMEAAAILKQYSPGRVRIFHDQKYAGFLLYHVTKYQPQQVVFVDQRIELPPDAVWRLYEAAVETSAWKGIFQQYDITAAVLNKADQPGLIEALHQEPGWKLRHEDEFTAFFMAKN